MSLFTAGDQMDEYERLDTPPPIPEGRNPSLSFASTRSIVSTASSLESKGWAISVHQKRQKGREGGVRAFC